MLTPMASGLDTKGGGARGDERLYRLALHDMTLHKTNHDSDRRTGEEVERTRRVGREA